MHISKVNNINFKENYWEFSKYGNKSRLKRIMTDNISELGKIPVLIDSKNNEYVMSYDGLYYSTPVNGTSYSYRIFYKDTGLWENDGKEVKINKKSVQRKIEKADKLARNNLSNPIQFNKYTYNNSGLELLSKMIKDGTLNNTELFSVQKDKKQSAPDFVFNLYTQVPENSNKILIIMRAGKNKNTYPAQIEYNKSSKELTILASENEKSNWILDTKENIVGQNIEEDTISLQWPILAYILKVLSENAIKIEKEFGFPQNIKGSIKNGEIIISGTRNLYKALCNKI